MNAVKKLLVVTALAAVSGCMGNADDIEGAQSASVDVPAGTEPLGLFTSNAALAATPPSCEHRIPANAEFRLLSSGVVVALNSAGMPVCTDEVEDVQAELVATGRVGESRALGNSYLVSVGIGVPIRAGDPSPQPSTEACDGVRSASNASGHVRDTAPDDHVQPGDPSPQPSVQECRTEMPPL
ncbi:MAG: hypothetical protein H6719_04935 [Sandaracinaceae bacterium]|nr:hypothetical protein [Sandaracinaceae bacterium]